MDAPFPRGVKVGNRKIYRRRAIRVYMAAILGEPEPAPHPDDENWLSSREVRRMLGGVSHMFLWRREHPRSEAA